MHDVYTYIMVLLNDKCQTEQSATGIIQQTKMRILQFLLLVYSLNLLYINFYYKYQIVLTFLHLISFACILKLFCREYSPCFLEKKPLMNNSANIFIKLR